MQVWCLAIACVQLALFYTGKSFWPLIIFTVVIAVMYTYRQLSIWQMDKKRNDNPIKLVNGQTIRSGDLRPGHEIKIFPDELIPADILITSVDDPKRRFYLNEVQVTGENTPVRKLIYKHTVEKIEIKDLNERKLIVTGETTRVVDDTMIGFANSLLISGHAQVRSLQTKI
jgi:magnesium-transporting ATPase (P-type)